MTRPYSHVPPIPQNQKTITPAQAAQHIIRVREASLSFKGFVNAVLPTLIPDFPLAPFHEELIEVLDSLERRTLGKLNVLITMPPRHAKSLIASQLFPAYFMARAPTRKILEVAYGSSLAANFGRTVRDFMVEPIVQQAFPALELSQTSTAIDDWMTTEGGKYYACGVGGGTTGRPANLLLIDDPIKNRQEAEQAGTRNKVWNFYNSSLNNRKEPEYDGSPAIELLIQTRWHPDDLAGRIMDSADWKDGDWHHVNFSAIRKVQTQVLKSRAALDPTDPRYVVPALIPNLPPSQRDIKVEQDAALWPERFPLDFLYKMQRRDPREFAALYQQTPYIVGGNLIKIQWFQTYAPHHLPEKFQTRIITADTAVKTKSINDPSVLLEVGLTSNGDIFILNIIRERLDYPSLKRRFLMENARLRGKGLRGIYVEDASSGSQILQDLRKEPGLSIIPYRYPGKNVDKVIRANAVIPLIEGGRVFIPEDAPWLDTFLDEVQSFPNGKHDDQVDCLTMALDLMSRVATTNSTSYDFPDLNNSLNNLVRSNPNQYNNSLSPDTDPRAADFLHSNWKNFKPLGEL